MTDAATNNPYIAFVKRDNERLKERIDLLLKTIIIHQDTIRRLKRILDRQDKMILIGEKSWDSHSTN